MPFSDATRHLKTILKGSHLVRDPTLQGRTYTSHARLIATQFICSRPFSEYSTRTPLTLLSGRQVASEWQQELAAEVNRVRQAIGRAPGLAVVMVGQRPDSLLYVSRKLEACSQVGVVGRLERLCSDVTLPELEDTVKGLCEDTAIDGVLVQLPLPQHLSEDRVVEALSPHKDVDGFHPLNIGRVLMRGRESHFIPCTALGVIELLKRSGIQIKGKTAVVVGDSNIVGLPLSMLFRDAGTAAVTVCHRMALTELMHDKSCHNRAAQRAVADVCLPRLPGPMYQPEKPSHGGGKPPAVGLCGQGKGPQTSGASPQGQEQPSSRGCQPCRAEALNRDGNFSQRESMANSAGGHCGTAGVAGPSGGDIKALHVAHENVGASHQHTWEISGEYGRPTRRPRVSLEDPPISRKPAGSTGEFGCTASNVHHSSGTTPSLTPQAATAERTALWCPAPSPPLADFDLPKITRTADILVIGVGSPELVKADWVKPGAVVVDVGINVVGTLDSLHDCATGVPHTYRVIGDVDFGEVSRVASAITPVPGGIGPMTIAAVLHNTIQAAKDHAGMNSFC